MATVKRLNTAYTIDAPSVTITGNLIIQGTQSVIDTVDTSVKDNKIVLNAGEAGSGVTAGTAGIEIDRGGLSNVSIIWNESIDQWQITNDGVTFSNLLSSDYETLTVGNLSLAGETISSTGNIKVDPSDVGIFQIVSTSAFGLPTGNSIQRPSSPELGFFRFNTELESIEYYNGTIWTKPQATNDVISSELFIANGAQTTFTLANVAATDSVIVSLNGIVQIPTISYTVSGNVLTFNETPLANANVEVRNLTSTIGVVEWATRMSVANTAPITEAPQIGDMWWNPLLSEMSVYELSSWVVASRPVFAKFAGNTDSGYLSFNGNVKSNGVLYSGSTNPSNNTRLNYDGNLHVTNLNSNSAITSVNLISTDVAATNINVSEVIAANISAGNVVATTFYGDGTNLTGVILDSELIGRTAANVSGSGYLVYAGNVRTSGQLYGGNTNPTSSTRLNYDGHFYATKLYGDGAGLTGISFGTTYSDDVATNATFYPSFTDGVGTTGNASISTTKLTFNPSTGTLGATIFNSLSDEKLKTDVQIIQNAVGIVNQLQGVEFNWVDNNKKSAGVIAQQIETILPHLVDQANGNKNVNYLGIIAYLIEAIKELNARISDIENR